MRLKPSALKNNNACATTLEYRVYVCEVEKEESLALGPKESESKSKSKSKR